MYLQDGRMVNSNGIIYSEPVYANSLPPTVYFTGYPINQELLVAFHGPFDGRYIWSYKTTSGFYRFDTITKTVTDAIPVPQEYSDDLAYFGLCDGEYLWSRNVVNGELLKININTLEFVSVPIKDENNNILLQDYRKFTNNFMTLGGNFMYIYYEAIVNGKAQQSILKIDIQTGIAKKSFINPANVGVYQAFSLTLVEDYLWLVNGFAVVKMNVNTMQFTTVAASVSNSSSPHGTAHYDGNGYIWYYNTQLKHFMKINVSTNQVTKLNLSGTNLGTANSSTPLQTMVYSCFDGRNIWLMPAECNRYIRVDTQTGSMQGYDLFGNYDYGNIGSTGIYYFMGCHFDGDKVWCAAKSPSNRMVCISRTKPATEFLVTEKYLDENNEHLVPEVTNVVQEGASYTKAVEQFRGYDYVGYKVDGGVLQSGDTVNLASVIQDHIITFIYQKKVFTITEEYLNEVINELLGSKQESVEYGEDYTAIAPDIQGYTCQGYKLDGGLLQNGTAVTLSQIKAAHTITFVYEKIAIDDCICTPPGAVMAFATKTPPKGWLECDGSEVSRIEYTDLFAAIGIDYGGGNCLDTFNLPDLRGEFIRGWDNGRGKDTGRALGSAQGDAMRKIEGTISTNASIGLTSSVETVGTGALTNEGMPSQPQAWGPIVDINSAGIKLDSSRVVPTADETRPYNVAMLYCIKY